MTELTNLEKEIWKIIGGEEYYKSLEFRVGQIKYPISMFMKILIDRLFYIEISKIEKFKNRDIKIFNNSYKGWQTFGSMLHTNYDVISGEKDQWIIKILIDNNLYEAYNGPSNKETIEIFEKLDKKGFIKINTIEKFELYTNIYFTIDPEKIKIYHNYTRLLLKEM